MGRILIKSKKRRLLKSIYEWSENNSFTVTETKSENKIKAKGGLFTAIWEYRINNDNIDATLIVKPLLYFNILLHLILFSSLFYSVLLINALFQSYIYTKVFQLAFFASLTIFLIWWRDNKLTSKLVKIEKSFWNTASQHYDLFQLTLFQGNIYARKYRFATEISLTAFAIYTCTIALGAWGFVTSLGICFFLLIMITAELIRGDNPHWNWRFWILSNMGTWTFLMISMLGLFLVLIATEFFLPLELYKKNNMISVHQAIETGHFRNITPSVSSKLENDCKKYFWGRAESDFNYFEETKNHNKQVAKIHWVKARTRTYCIVFLILIVITTYYFSIKPLLSLLREQSTWKYQIANNDSHPPFVPYMPQAWKWKTPRKLQLLIFLHWIVGGIFNIIIAVLCIDGISYLLIGKPLIFEKAANIWSWIFTPNKILFGNTIGQLIGGVFVIIITLPILLLFLTLIRRSIKGLCILAKSLFTYRRNFILSEISKQTKQIASDSGIKPPKIVLNSSKSVIINLYYFPIINCSIIVLSKGALDILQPQELIAAITHELGHIKQGLWKVSILKCLSTLALFPNYYLTLCMDWPQKEIKADKFVLEVTKDAPSLKQALIKCSTSQISSLNMKRKTNSNFILRLQNKWRSIIISAKFFFGDTLFGYTHPFLSERLEAIDSYKR